MTEGGREREGGAGADRPGRYTVKDACYGTYSLGPSKNVEFAVPGRRFPDTWVLRRVWD